MTFGNVLSRLHPVLCGLCSSFCTTPGVNIWEGESPSHSSTKLASVPWAEGCVCFTREIQNVLRTCPHAGSLCWWQFFQNVAHCKESFLLVMLFTICRQDGALHQSCYLNLSSSKKWDLKLYGLPLMFLHSAITYHILVFLLNRIEASGSSRLCGCLENPLRVPFSRVHCAQVCVRHSVSAQFVYWTRNLSAGAVAPLGTWGGQWGFWS